jgi:hypothetical protein
VKYDPIGQKLLSHPSMSEVFSCWGWVGKDDGERISNGREEKFGKQGIVRECPSNIARQMSRKAKRTSMEKMCRYCY